MNDSVEKIVERHRKAALRVRKENRDPAKARAFLIRAGIAEKCPTAPNGIRLVKDLR
jgi:hypothetical protein